MGNTYIVQASASSSLPVTFTASNGNVSINGNTITALQSGYVSIKANQEGNDVYNPTTSTQNIVIYSIDTTSKTDQSITFETIPNLIIGDAYILQASASSSLPVTFTASNGNVSINGNTITALQSGVSIITAIQEGNEIYNPTTEKKLVSITDPSKKSQIIIFELQDAYLLGTLQTLTSIASSSLPVAYFTNNDDIASIENSTLVPKDTGEVIIAAYQEGNEEYNPSNIVAKTTHIIARKLLQFITFQKLSSKSVTDAPFTLSATSTSLLQVLYSASSTIVNIKENTVTIKGGGLVGITAYQPGNNIHNEASPVIQFFTINKRSQVIDFPVIPTKTIGDLTFRLFATASSLLPVSYSSSNSTIAFIVGNTVTMKTTGTVGITAYQLGNDIYEKATCGITCYRILIISGGTSTNTLTFTETLNNKIHIFPNPANDYITIQTDKTQTISSVKVYDIMGKVVNVGGGNFLPIQLDVKTLPQGEYVMVVYGGKGEVLKVEKIIIH